MTTRFGDGDGERGRTGDAYGEEHTPLECVSSSMDEDES